VVSSRWTENPEISVQLRSLPLNGPEVKWLRYPTVSRNGAGSTPVRTAIIPCRLIGRTQHFDCCNFGSNPNEVTFIRRVACIGAQLDLKSSAVFRGRVRFLYSPQHGVYSVMVARRVVIPPVAVRICLDTLLESKLKR
jgi:hypothetical protein